MFNPSVSQLLVEARVEQIHRAARNDARNQIDRPAAGVLASLVARAIVRAFDAGRSAGNLAGTIRGFEFAGHGSTTTWSPLS